MDKYSFYTVVVAPFHVKTFLFCVYWSLCWKLIDCVYGSVSVLCSLLLICFFILWQMSLCFNSVASQQILKWGSECQALTSLLVIVLAVPGDRPFSYKFQKQVSLGYVQFNESPLWILVYSTLNLWITLRRVDIFMCLASSDPYLSPAACSSKNSLPTSYSHAAMSCCYDSQLPCNSCHSSSLTSLISWSQPVNKKTTQ